MHQELFKDWLTNCMQKRSLSETDTHSAGQEFPYILWNPRVIIACHWTFQCAHSSLGNGDTHGMFARWAENVCSCTDAERALWICTCISVQRTWQSETWKGGGQVHGTEMTHAATHLDLFVWQWVVPLNVVTIWAHHCFTLLIKMTSVKALAWVAFRKSSLVTREGKLYALRQTSLNFN